MKRFVILALVLTGCSNKIPQLSESSSQGIHNLYLRLIAEPGSLDRESLETLVDEWHLNHVPMILETIRFSNNRPVDAALVKILEIKTGQTFGDDLHAWREWLWSKDYEPLPEYADFKLTLYRSIDPKFASYFEGRPKATIRLDEIRWGGVVQDGIPPLRQPKMITADAASYLGEDNVVFGIEVNGESRAYPKRILAWHEMFVDTIQGIELAGVY